MEEHIRKHNQYTMGWMGYFALIEIPSHLKRLEEWIRRLRLCHWHQWKKVRTRIRELRALGLKKHEVFEIANTRIEAWHTTRTPQLNKALVKAYWLKQGLKSLTQIYFELRQDWRTA
ncbi:group II intron maturase-specific domain-containing protein [Caenibacillus caldisaponilyticus]|uniref:group II intron maturase-specific domain-containing protein n=1 Tax=Caenibacillus caldisaponilyticus TaxID=1674942 RepID=UPI001EE73AA7|nr:group II intron maturase-specific domain-containing protein [Caenibacillus caldisaponilyticus]